MATQVVKIGEEVTVGASEDVIVIDETNNKLTKPLQKLRLKCKTGNSGTIKFSVGESAPAAAHAYAATEVADMTVENGLRNLRAIGSAAAQVFTIENP